LRDAAAGEEPVGISIEQVRGGRGLHQFVTLPWRVYRGDPNWVPPLIGEMKKTLTRHPFLDHAEVSYYLARRGRDVVGRIAYILNHRHNETHDERTAFFGFFEALPDPEAEDALFLQVQEEARRAGMKTLRGPANFSSNEEWALLVDGFDSPPSIMMTYNPPRYAGVIERAGFRKARDLLAYYLDNPEPPERILRAAERMAERRGVTIREIDKRRLDDEVALVQRVYNAAWEKNWGFVPMTEAEIRHMAKELQTGLKTEIVLLAERNGEPVGFCLALPDYNAAIRHANGRLFPVGLLKILWHMRRIRKLRVLALGLVPELRRSGIDQLFYLRLFQGGRRLGIDQGEFSWVLEDNLAMRQALEKMGCRVQKTYRVYEKDIV
jgi:RimJ/RimL family protein N-acetyltransferase